MRMRNPKQESLNPIGMPGWKFQIILLFLLAGCTGNAQSRQELHSGKLALDSQQYNQAILDADAVIAGGDAPALAEAYYLRGYAIEMRPKTDNAAAAHDLLIELVHAGQQMRSGLGDVDEGEVRAIRAVGRPRRLTAGNRRPVAGKGHPIIRHRL